MIGTRALDWYRGRTRRERWLVSVGGILALFIVALYGVALPLSAALEAARARHDEAVIRAGRIAAKVQLLERAGQAPPPVPPTGVLAAVVSASAAEQGFSVSQLQARGENRLRLTLPAVRPAALFAWLSGLEAEGIRVGDLRVSALANGTLSASIELVRSS